MRKTIALGKKSEFEEPIHSQLEKTLIAVYVPFFRMLTSVLFLLGEGELLPGPDWN